MYHPKVVGVRLNKMADQIRKTTPNFTFQEIPVEVCREFTDNLSKIYNPETENPTRSLTDEENAFILHEISRSKVDFDYWCRRYAFIKDKEMNLVRLTPTSVQQLILDRIAKAEFDALTNKSGDGVLLAILKARQLGASTFTDIAISHRTNFYANTTALIAPDVDERISNLYEMVDRCLTNLPWWMRARSLDPKKDTRVKNKYIAFYDQDSVIRFTSSSNMQGGSSGEAKGSIGTGMTLPLVHLSEVALYKNPGQISDALLPSIPYSARTFAIFESTAKGIDNWWYDNWQQAKRGIGRLTPVFIPWYTDPNTYKLPAPLDWSPSEKARAHAERVAITSPRWVGKTVNLSRDQLFWWEKTRAEYESRRELYKFLAEYTSDDEESFQSTMGGPFPAELIDSLRLKAKLPIYIDMGVQTNRGQVQLQNNRA